MFVGAIAIWVDRLLSASGLLQGDAATAQFTGRINVAFALLILGGVLGVANGWRMAHSGRRNRVLIFGLVIVFVSALFVACSASNAYRGP